MDKTDKEVLELCKLWFEAIHGVVKNYTEFVNEHLQNRWKPSDEQMLSLERASNSLVSKEDTVILRKLLNDLKKLMEE